MPPERSCPSPDSEARTRSLQVGVELFDPAGGLRTRPCCLPTIHRGEMIKKLERLTHEEI